jgi:hypothetical protein
MQHVSDGEMADSDVYFAVEESFITMPHRRGENKVARGNVLLLAVGERSITQASDIS